MNVKISDLTSAVAINDGDYLPIVQGETTKKITKELLTGDIYSTSVEQKVGTWIDGKTIYRKVLDFGAITSGSVDTDVANLSIDTVIKLRPWLYRTSNATAESGNQDQELTDWYASSTDLFRIFYRKSTSGSFIRRVLNTNQHNLQLKVILEYTKTTE